MSDPLRRQGADLLVDLRLTPRADRDAVEGVKTLADGRAVVTARVRAVPEDGKANAAAIALLAASAGVARSTVTLVAGATMRVKTLRLADASAETERALRSRLGI